MRWWLLVPAWYAIVSAVTLGAFALDKRAATRGRWRTKEKTLHILELLGGWPGALVGQALVRHKTRKTSYKLVLWGIIALHLGAWGAVLYLLRPWEV
jgi:uncharacterized membrane protein YsdA (DUF1294 family)